MQSARPSPREGSAWNSAPPASIAPPGVIRSSSPSTPALLLSADQASPEPQLASRGGRGAGIGPGRACEAGPARWCVPWWRHRNFSRGCSARSDSKGKSALSLPIRGVFVLSPRFSPAAWLSSYASLLATSTRTAAAEGAPRPPGRPVWCPGCPTGQSTCSLGCTARRHAHQHSLCRVSPETALSVSLAGVGFFIILTDFQAVASRSTLTRC